MDINSTKPATILVVDDTIANLTLMTDLLKSLYRVKAATSGEAALKVIRTDPPDLILLDIMMPGMSGFELCQLLKADPAMRQIPVIFLTALGAVEDETLGLKLGATDYITKPINPPIVLARVANTLQLKAAADFMRDKNAFLEEEVDKRTKEVRAVQDVTILAMASMAETRDNETGNHIRRTQHYVKLLAEKLSAHPRFGHYLDPETVILLFKSAPLHDIGKVGIPDHILLKPGRYEPHEFEIMKAHPRLGRDAIQQAEDHLGMSVPFLSIAKEIAYGHQEKWDGSGYPEGLAGDDIPISARLMAVADVYDALISRRVYKEGMPHEKAVAIMIDGRGKHFDPDILDAFLALQDQFRGVAARFQDSDSDLAAKAAQFTHQQAAQDDKPA
ncbi:response regulator [Janthinobacterium lividum]|uniref:response regulator n=1 Tax=Janthinobacterium lividum TaxID=29581 RepID=UPI00140C1B64|nr:two-component system response regulator [Janthinobacterium lividum]NHQ94046.1 two-component system response regulator [Janthinobacterium lividum]